MLKGKVSFTLGIFFFSFLVCLFGLLVLPRGFLFLFSLGFLVSCFRELFLGAVFCCCCFLVDFVCLLGCGGGLFV